MKINRRSLLIPWALLIALFVVMIRQSVSYGMTRLAIVVIGIVVIAGLLYFLWKQTIVRWSTIAAIGSVSVGRVACVSTMCQARSMDYWEAYQTVIPSKRHEAVGKDSGKTSYIERLNNAVRQRIARLVGKSLSFSKKVGNHIGEIWYFIGEYNRQIRLESARNRGR